MKTLLTGSCHCKAVKFSALMDVENDRNAVCSCSRCQGIGFLHHHVNKSVFTLIEGSEHLTLWEFETRQAKHWFCKFCGVQSFYQSRSDPNMMDINLRCVDGIDIYGLKYWIVHGQKWQEAQDARRAHEAAGTKPKLYSILTECTGGCEPATIKAFEDSLVLPPPSGAAPSAP